jgi:hypothetical protein
MRLDLCFSGARSTLDTTGSSDSLKTQECHSPECVSSKDVEMDDDRWVRIVSESVPPVDPFHISFACASLVLEGDDSSKQVASSGESPDMSLRQSSRLNVLDEKHKVVEWALELINPLIEPLGLSLMQCDDELDY